MAPAPKSTETVMQLKLSPQSELAKAQVASLDTPLNKNRPQAALVQTETPGSQESDTSPYGAVIAAFVLMGAIAIRRHRSGRS